MKPKKLARRRAICHFIRAFVAEHGYSPTLREMADGVGITSTAHITYWRDLLAFEELITYELYIARSIRLTPAGEALANEEEPDAPPAA